MTSSSPEVLILMGSESDVHVMEEAKKVLDEFGVVSRMHIASAHRTPAKVQQLVKDGEANNIKIFIAGAGHAAHLAGVVAAHTTRPVIGVPIDSSSLGGLDALLATAQMPSGVPVATTAIGKSGAKNAGVLAVQILALHRPELQKQLVTYKQQMAKKVEDDDHHLAD